MKQLLIILSLTLSNLIVGQEMEIDSIFNFKIQENSVVWQKVFDSDLDLENLMKAFENNILVNIGAVDMNTLDDRMTFKVIGDKTDFQKYGGTWGSTALFAQYPFNYLAVIDFKDKRYRVTIRNIISDYTAAKLGTSDLTETVTKKKGEYFKSSKIINEGLKYFDLHFNEEYEINNLLKENDKW